jgi:N-acetylglutamate synthase-like GNAT family acetyltransferase
MLTRMRGASLRRAATADVAAIRELVTDAYDKYVQRIGRAPAPMTADYAAALEHSRVWLLESDGAVVGALVTEDRDDHLLLEMIAVAPGAQGCGYGKRLLDRAELDAAELGLTEVRLYTNEAMTENLTSTRATATGKRAVRPNKAFSASISQKRCAAAELGDAHAISISSAVGRSPLIALRSWACRKDEYAVHGRGEGDRISAPARRG